jgi:hypothetical protein
MKPFAEGGYSSPPGLVDRLEALLPTPTAQDGRADGKSNTRGAASITAGGGMMDVALRLLPSPRANDGLRPRVSTVSEGYGKPLEQALVEFALTGEPTRRQSPDGRISSAGLRLNPCFVEWMMGLPLGWSDPDCRLSATEFSYRPAGSAAGASSNTRQDL